MKRNSRVAELLPGSPQRQLLERELPKVVDGLRGAGLHQAWLVGGSVRDGLLGRGGEPLDLDLAIPGDGAAAARCLAGCLGGSAFPLDEAQGAWRVAVSHRLTVDLVPLRAPDIAGDLSARDFTCNALGLDLFGEQGLLDPTGGVEDLAQRVLRPCGQRSLRDDPLRVLRAYRFRFALGLGFAPGLSEELAATAPGLEAVARERVRTELFAALGLEDGGRVPRALWEDGVLSVLFPFLKEWAGLDQGDYHAYDLLEHSLRAAEEVSSLAVLWNAEDGSEAGFGWLRDHLAELLEDGVSRRSLAVFCALFHDLAKPERRSLDGKRVRFIGHEVEGGRLAQELLADLRCGRRTQLAARRVVAAHLRLFQLAQQAQATPRARLRYLKDLRSEVPEAILVALADERATGPRPACWGAVAGVGRELLTQYHERLGRKPATPLLRGRDLLALGAAPGPRLGDILREIEELEQAGVIRSRRQALQEARRFLTQSTGD